MARRARRVQLGTDQSGAKIGSVCGHAKHRSIIRVIERFALDSWRYFQDAGKTATIGLVEHTA